MTRLSGSKIDLCKLGNHILTDPGNYITIDADDGMYFVNHHEMMYCYRICYTQWAIK